MMIPSLKAQSSQKATNALLIYSETWGSDVSPHALRLELAVAHIVVAPTSHVDIATWSCALSRPDQVAEDDQKISC